MSSETEAKTPQDNSKQSAIDVRKHLSTYGDQLMQYLKNGKVEIKEYKFAVDKIENGIQIDIALKALIKNKQD
jgi:hypothetical protein